MCGCDGHEHGQGGNSCSCCFSSKSDSLQTELKSLLNRYSRENASNTPDFILAQYMMSSLVAFETAIQQRETWYGRDPRPTWPPGLQAVSTGDQPVVPPISMPPTSREGIGFFSLSKRAVPRSPHWPHVEKFVKEMRDNRCDFLANDQPSDGPVQIHHGFPFEDCRDAGRPELELCLENLYAACETEKDQPADNHHLTACHMGNFKSFNAHLRDCVIAWRGLKSAEIQQRDDYKLLLAHMPVEFHAMTATAQEELKNDLNFYMPKDKITVWDGHNWVRNGVILSPEQAVIPDPFFTR